MRKDRYITVELTVYPDLLCNILSIGFQAAIEVVDVNPSDHGGHKIKKTRWNGLGNRIPSFLFPPGNQIKAFLDFTDEIRDFVRVVLQVSIHGDDDVALSMGKAHRKGCGLTVVSPETDNLHSSVATAQVMQCAHRAVRAAVI